jgi:hypothetical protein
VRDRLAGATVAAVPGRCTRRRTSAVARRPSWAAASACSTARSCADKVQTGVTRRRSNDRCCRVAHDVPPV